MTPSALIESKLGAASTLTESTQALSELLEGGFGIWQDGSLYFIRQLVARVGGYKVEIFAKEHRPPHFHLSGGDVNATFSLFDGSHLLGEISSREKALVKWWYERSRPLLIRTWNETRPTDCPVGPIQE
jgi:hypothetical protein